MSDNLKLVQEKLDQAVGILNELGIDAWMTFVRETSLSPDPSLDLILGMDMVWQSAFIVTRDNQRIAIVGQHDADNVKAMGGYTRIIPYIQGIRDDLLNTLFELNSKKIALNYSENDAAADGLGHGLMLLLQRYVGDSRLSDSFISAEPVISALRGRKSVTEIKRIKAAINATQDIFKQMEAFIAPGKSEVDIAQHAHSLLDQAGLGTAWDRAYCPAVTAGADSPVGHAGPQAKYKVKPGTLLHMDFGVKQDDYCADLQRVWYVRKAKEEVPGEVKKAFDAGRKALLAGFDALKPGAEGWQVDEAARRTLVEAGYPEYQHAFGHHLGRAAHDGATVLGPRWERYGQTPYGMIEAGNVFAIELGVSVPGYGLIGLEENVQVTDKSAQWLSDPQTDVLIIN
jgi:Xaa-Pro aminopeptidase